MRNVMRVFAAATLLAFGVVATADDKPITDDQFVIKAASSGMHEVELGQLAKTNAASPEVKKFGERMVEDHGKANKELMEIAKGANIGVPAKMLDEHQKMVDKFKKLRGAEFDREYTKHAVESHEKSVELFTNASKNLKDAKLRAFAGKTLPTVKEHLEHAKKLDKGAGGR